MENKEKILEWIGDLNELVGTVGPWVAIIILLIVLLISMVLMFSKQMNNLVSAIRTLSEQVSSPYMDPEESLIVFRSIMRDHIWTKLEFIGATLEKNHIDTRGPQIKKNIERKFKQITNSEAEKLSKFKTKCGDMGKTLTSEINWKEFLTPVYVIIFSEDEISKKVDDIHGIMSEWVDRIALVIEDNGIHNR